MGDKAMIIQDTIILPDGTVEVRDIEVADNYFDPPAEPEPSTENDLMNLSIDHEYRLTLLELGV